MTCDKEGETIRYCMCANIWFFHPFGRNLFASEVFRRRHSSNNAGEWKKIWRTEQRHQFCTSFTARHLFQYQVFLSRMQSSEKRLAMLSFNYDAVDQQNSSSTTISCLSNCGRVMVWCKIVCSLFHSISSKFDWLFPVHDWYVRVFILLWTTLNTE